MEIVSASPKVGKITSRNYDPLIPQGNTENLRLTVQCDISSLEREVVQKDGYDFYMIEGFEQSGVEPGGPVLPSSIIQILIPEGYEFYNITDVNPLKQDTEIVSNVFPQQKEGHPGEDNDQSFVPLQITPNGQRASIEYVHTARIRNHSMAILRYSPVQFQLSGNGYNNEGTFTISSSLEFCVVLSPIQIETVTQTFRRAGSEGLIDSYISDSVLNPEDLEQAAATQSDESTTWGSTPCDYLIITTLALVDEFQVLADHRAAMGLAVDVVAVEDIYDEYDGVGSNQAMIKQCILDYAQTRGTLWVLLGGDNTIVPDHNCYGSVNNGDTTDLTIPTDLYYAGLNDMNWNDDQDSIPCEINANGDSIDLYPDLFVGRAPVRSAADAQAFASKTIAYETAAYDPYFHEAALFMGVKLWSSADGRSDADWKSEALWSNIHENRSPVLPADKYRFYDTGTDFDGGADYNVTLANMSAQLNSGYGIVWTATHGDKTLFSLESGYGYFRSSAASSLVNQDHQGIVYTMACNTNWFDSTTDPSLSEAFIRNPGGGAVAYIGSSRYGWGYSSLTPTNIYYGSSMQYAEQFFKMLYYDEDLLGSTNGSADPSMFDKRIGAVFSSHKMKKIPNSLTYSSMRWLQFSLNLMGDPFTKVMVKLPQDSDLDRDLDGEDLVAFINLTSTTAPDLWELAQRFGQSAFKEDN